MGFFHHKPAPVVYSLLCYQSVVFPVVYSLPGPQIGNLSNDGYKLGYNLSTCSLDPPSVLARCTALHCTALHCTELHCTALHCTALHCTALVDVTR